MDPKPESPDEQPSRFYRMDDIRKALSKKHNPKHTKLRPDITPGTLLVNVYGRFKGKKVVFLKQLPSGLLLVNDPFKTDGVPLRRVDQAFVMATTTKVDISAIDVDKFDDKFFSKEVSKKKSKEKKDKPKTMELAIDISCGCRKRRRFPRR